MPDKAQYLANADYCRQMAESESDAEARHAYLMAEQSWRLLAEAAKRAPVAVTTGHPTPG